MAGPVDIADTDAKARQRRKRTVNGNRYAVRKVVYLDPRDDAEGDVLDLIDAAATVGRLQPFLRSMLLAGVAKSLRTGTVPPSIRAEADRVRAAKGLPPLTAPPEAGDGPPAPSTTDVGAVLAALAGATAGTTAPTEAPSEGAPPSPAPKPQGKDTMVRRSDHHGRPGPPDASHDDGGDPPPRVERTTSSGDGNDDILALMGFGGEEGADPF